MVTYSCENAAQQLLVHGDMHISSCFRAISMMCCKYKMGRLECIDSYCVDPLNKALSHIAI